MHLLMRDLLGSYNSLNTSLKKNYKLIKNKWIRILKDNNISYVNAYIYENGMTPRNLELHFMVQTSETLTSNEKSVIENEACCKLTDYDKLSSNLGDTHYYTFTPLKIIPTPVDESWLKD